MSYCPLVPFTHNVLHEFERINGLELVSNFWGNCYLVMRSAFYGFQPGRVE